MLDDSIARASVSSRWSGDPLELCLFATPLQHEKQIASSVWQQMLAALPKDHEL
jgi:hypothetical protein